MIPRIETDRLILRGHKLEDFSQSKVMWADEIVTRHTIGKPSSEQQTWARLCTYLGHWALLNFGYWALEEKKTGLLIGDLGFADFKRELDPSISGTPEMGWALIPAAHGKGYASEAIAAALSWGDKNLKSKRTACIINPENVRSIKLAEKFGFQWKQDTIYLDKDIKLYFRSANSPSK